MVTDAARRVFERVGLDDASIRLIAEEAGCTTGAIYPWFASKEEVYAAILAESLDHLTTYIAKRIGRDNEGARVLKRSIAITKRIRLKSRLGCISFAVKASSPLD